MKRIYGYEIESVTNADIFNTTNAQLVTDDKPKPFNGEIIYLYC